MKKLVPVVDCWPRADRITESCVIRGNNRRETHAVIGCDYLTNPISKWVSCLKLGLYSNNKANLSIQRAASPAWPARGSVSFAHMTNHRGLPLDYLRNNVQAKGNRTVWMNMRSLSNAFSGPNIGWPIQLPTKGGYIHRTNNRFRCHCMWQEHCVWKQELKKHLLWRYVFVMFGSEWLEEQLSSTERRPMAETIAGMLAGTSCRESLPAWEGSSRHGAPIDISRTMR